MISLSLQTQKTTARVSVTVVTEFLFIQDATRSAAIKRPSFPVSVQVEPVELIVGAEGDEMCPWCNFLH